MHKQSYISICQLNKIDTVYLWFQNYPIVGASTKSEETVLDETGFIFVSKCITTLEDRGEDIYDLIILF